MKQQALSSRLTYGRAIPISNLVSQIGDRAQTNTQHYGKRPYGVGLLVAGIDDSGPHLFEFQPSGMTQEMAACAIGARSQMARTYLERNLDHFENCGKAELVRHGVKALKESLAQDQELTVENTSVPVIGKGTAATKRKIEPFKLYDGEEVSVWLEGTVETSAAEGSTESAGETMEVDS